MLEVSPSLADLMPGEMHLRYNATSIPSALKSATSNDQGSCAAFLAEPCTATVIRPQDPKTAR